MRHRVWFVAIIFATLISAVLHGQKRVNLDVTGEYDWIPGWLKPVEEGRIIHPVTVFAETADRIFIGLNGTSPIPKPSEPRADWIMDPKVPGARVDHQVFVVNRDGKVIEEWKQWSELFGSIHKITQNPYDPEKHVWIIDRVSQQIMEFTNDGKKLIRAIGTKGEAGEDNKHFNRPADICWLPDGTFFVADGFGNNRVVKFSKDGNYVMAWGRKGTRPGQFDLVDAVAVDAKRRVWVTDRKNARIQIFDENGKFLDMWSGFEEPQKVLITPDQYVWILDAALARFAKYDMNGKLLTYWGTDADPQSNSYGRLVPGGLAWPHDFAIDPDGNLYVSNGRNWTIDKYVPKKDADKSRIVAQPYF
jgi:peptidylamidoglycolate lyase